MILLLITILLLSNFCILAASFTFLLFYFGVRFLGEKASGTGWASDFGCAGLGRRCLLLAFKNKVQPVMIQLPLNELLHSG